MSDDADQASTAIERENDALVAAALRVAQVQAIGARVRCANCGEDLVAYRRPYGLCIECARVVEVRRAQHGR